MKKFLIGFLVFALVAMFSIPAMLLAADKGPNLIVNGDFESGVLGPWQYVGTVYVETEEGDGNPEPGLFLDNTGSGAGPPFVWQNVDFDPGIVDITKLFFSMDMKSDQANVEVYVGFVFYDPSWGDGEGGANPDFYLHEIYHYLQEDWNTYSVNLSDLEWDFWEYDPNDDDWELREKRHISQISQELDRLEVVIGLFYTGSAYLDNVYLYEIKPAPKPSVPAPTGPAIDQMPLSSYETSSLGASTFFYNRLLGRTPDPEGMAFWADAVEQGLISGSDMLYAFVFSMENQARISAYSNEEFIDYLYRSIFNRGPDEEGNAFWLSMMAATASREYIVRNFALSGEFMAICEYFGIRP